MTRTYTQGVATIGFNGGPQVVFRLNPNAVDWNFQINTNVTETIGGRVVQVLGATLSNLTIKGSFGESRGRTHTESKVLAERFLASMKTMADRQSKDSNTHGKMHEPAVFTFPTKGWRFQVYIMDLTDPSGGGSIMHKVGKFAYDYVLTLFIHSDLSNTSKIIGSSNGVLDKQKNRAVQSYMDRIANGIGWHASDFNGPGAAALTRGSPLVTGGVGGAHATDNTPHGGR